MADNQKPRSGKDGDRKSRSKVKQGVILSAAEIEKERQRLYKRPRAALYPLLPIMEPTKMKRQSIRIVKNKRRHRKHCRKRLHQVEPEEATARSGLDSRTRLVATASESEGSSLACSKAPVVTLTSTGGLNNQFGECSSSCKPGGPLSDWGSIELYADDLLVSDVKEDDGILEVERQPPAQPLPPAPHHHHYHHRHRHRMCHHYKARQFACKHRSSITTTRSLDDLRKITRDPSSFRRPLRLDPEVGGLQDDRDSASSNSKSRKIVSFIVGSVASFILLMCVALVAVTLRLTPAIDELVRKENEDIYRAMSAGPTPPPGSDNANVNVANSTATGQPG